MTTMILSVIFVFASTYLFKNKKYILGLISFLIGGAFALFTQNPPSVVVLALLIAYFTTPVKPTKATKKSPVGGFRKPTMSYMMR